MSDKAIQKAIDDYLLARHALLQLSRKHPSRIGGNDNLIGHIGEFIALRFFEGRGRAPIKVASRSNRGFDLRDGTRKIQVKVITEENQLGRNVRLKTPWSHFLLIELGQHYRPTRIGLLTKGGLKRACQDNRGWSATPIVKRTMLSPKGLIGRYGKVYSGRELKL